MTGLLASLFGCAEPPTFDDALRGEVEVQVADREAMEELLAATGAQPSDVLLLPAEDDYGDEPYAKIEDGRVTRLALREVTDAGAAGRLAGLRELRLSGPFEALELSGLKALESVEVLSWDESLRRLELSDLPSLRSLSVHGADLPDDLDLRGLPLRSLSLNHSGLSTVPRVDPGELETLSLSGNELESLGPLAGFEALETLRLARTGIETLEGLPTLPNLRTLDLGHNPLRPDLALAPSRVPSLGKLDLSYTGLRAAPLGLRDREDLRLSFERGVAETAEFEATLARLRQSYADAPGERVQKVENRSGTIRGSSGRCSWKTSTHRPAEVSCRFTYETVRGTAMVRLGETDPAMPFRGGGAPRVAVSLSVREGEAAIYVREKFDLVATARFVSGLSEKLSDEKADEIAEGARRPTDTFDGYRRVVARPGGPATVQGDVLLLGSRVVLLIEAVGEPARGVELVVEPV